MTNQSNANPSNTSNPTLNDLATIQNENMLISCTCDQIIDSIFNLANRQGAEDDFHAETVEGIVKQIHEMKMEAENAFMNARIEEYRETCG